MATIPFHGLKDNWYAALNGGINSSTTSIVIDGAGAGAEPATPFYLNIAAEAMECTAVAVDTPGVGESTLTVVRGALGTTASSQSDNAVVEQNAYAQHWTELQNRLLGLEFLVYVLLGAQNGVIPESSTPLSLIVYAQDTPDMTVGFGFGSAVVSSQVVSKTSLSNSSTFTAPVTNPRIDTVQINRSGVVSVKTGTEAGSPTAPAVDADNLKLAEIYLRVGATSIKNTDDTTNGYITDSRVFI